MFFWDKKNNIKIKFKYETQNKNIFQRLEKSGDGNKKKLEKCSAGYLHFLIFLKFKINYEICKRKYFYKLKNIFLKYFYWKKTIETKIFIINFSSILY